MGRRFARVAQIDFVVAAVEGKEVLGHQLVVKMRKDRTFIVVAADVERL